MGPTRGQGVASSAESADSPGVGPLRGLAVFPRSRSTSPRVGIGISAGGPFAGWVSCVGSLPFFLVICLPGYAVTNPFDACWHRIDRAEAHRDESAAIWNEWLEDEPYSVVLDHQGEGKFVVKVVQESPTPPEMAVLMGEWFYNLRCALDYAVYATAICDSGKTPPPGDGVLEFPCSFTEDHFRKQEYRLKPLSDYHRVSLVEAMQPYRHEDPDTSALGWLHKLARIDRHRRLTFMLGVVKEIQPIAGVPVGCVVKDQWAERVVIDGEAEIAGFTVTPWNDGWKVNVNPRAGIDPEIGDWAESPFWQRWRYNDRLVVLRTTVESVVAPLEYSCLGTGRKADILTEAFRAECDARRQPGG